MEININNEEIELSQKPIILCKTHPRNIITQICLKNECQQFPLCCNLCPHENHLFPISSGFSLLSEQIESLLPSNSQVFNDFFMQPELQNIKKYLKDNTHHLKKVEDYLDIQKLQIAQEIVDVVTHLQEFCQKIKENLLLQINEYYIEYQKSFFSFKDNIDKEFALNTEFKYLGNPNNLNFKLQNIKIDEVGDKFNEIKQAIINAQKISHNSSNFFNLIKPLANNLNDFSDNLPVYEKSKDFELLISDLSDKLSFYFNNHLKIKNFKNKFGLKKIFQK